MSSGKKLECIQDTKSVENIMDLTECFIRQVNPLKIFLFGSFAKGTYNEDSDFDFYLVVDDKRSIRDTLVKAYQAVSDTKIRPVDIVVGSATRFETKSNSPHSLMIEGEVRRDGILLYDQERVAV